MTIDLGELRQLIAGQRRYVTVGNLPVTIQGQFGCYPGIVYLRNAEALHCLEHTELNQFDLLRMSLVVAHGSYYQDKKRLECFTVIYRAEDLPRPYMLALKMVGRGEVWVSTYHLTSEKKIRQRLKNWPLLRTQARE